MLTDPTSPQHTHLCTSRPRAGVLASPPWCSSRVISRPRVHNPVHQNCEETALKQLPHPRLPQPACALTSGSPDSGPVGRDSSRGGAREPEGPGVPGVHPEDVLPAANSDPFLPGACPDLVPSPTRHMCCRGTDRPHSVNPASSLRLRDGSELPGASPEWRAVCGVSRGPTSDSALALGPEALASSARCSSILECLPSGLPDSACFLVAWKVSSVVLGFPARN